jgi:hypothetical protein
MYMISQWSHDKETYSARDSQRQVLLVSFDRSFKNYLQGCRWPCDQSGVIFGAPVGLVTAWVNRRRTVYQ